MIASSVFSGSRLGALLAGGALLLGVAPAVASAQDVDGRWLPWLGCWEAAEGGEESPMLCVRPTTSGEGVEFVTWAEGQVLSSEVIRADGVARDATREGCEGTEEARFSADGHRVYLKSSYVCEDGSRQSASGILAMMNPMQWVDVKVVGSGGERAPWAMQYRLARASKIEEAGMENVVAPRARAVKEARIAASAPLTIDDVVDAVAMVDPEGVETLIVERGEAFQVDAETLLALSDAGIPERVIDLVIAVSYPERFTVKPGAVKELPTERTARAYPAAFGRPFGWSTWNPYFYDPYYSGYGYGGYSSYYGYSGFGWGYYRPTTFIVQPRPDNYESYSPGRMVKGQGYTRGGSPSGGSSGTVSRGTSGGASGSSAASGGSSSGGSSSSGRTAVRRGGGGGGL